MKPWLPGQVRHQTGSHWWGGGGLDSLEWSYSSIAFVGPIDTHPTLTPIP